MGGGGVPKKKIKKKLKKIKEKKIGRKILKKNLIFFCKKIICFWKKDLKEENIKKNWRTKIFKKII